MKNRFRQIVNELRMSSESSHFPKNIVIAHRSACLLPWSRGSVHCFLQQQQYVCIYGDRSLQEWSVLIMVASIVYAKLFGFVAGCSCSFGFFIWLPNFVVSCIGTVVIQFTRRQVISTWLEEGTAQMHAVTSLAFFAIFRKRILVFLFRKLICIGSINVRNMVPYTLRSYFGAMASFLGDPGRF